MSDPEIPAPPPATLEEELVPEDDTIIGRAFVWSLIIFAAIGLVTGVGLWLVSRPADVLPPTPAVAVQPLPRMPTADPPDVRFTDITTGAGIDFVHVNGAAGDKLLPETMGGGCAFLDYDGDGDQDVLLVNSTHWPDRGHEGPPATMALYANDGTGHFDNVTVAAGLDVSFYGMGAAVGDVDNDGDTDVFLTAVGSNHLFRNDGGRFEDVTSAAGVAGDPREWSTSAGFVDHDGDGDLDLFVCNYVLWSRDIDIAVDFRLTGLGRAYGPPTNFQGTFPCLYRNDGDGTFTDISAGSGIQVTNPATGVPVAKALGVTFVDIGGDGRMDIFVANDTVRNFVFRNKGALNPRFSETGTAIGAAYSSMGGATGAMGIDAAHYRVESDALGFAIGNFANEMTSLYVSQNDPWLYTDEAIGEGIGAPSRLALSFGVFFFDYDLDGRLDLLQANGHLEEAINTVQPSQHYRQPAQLFWNAGPDSRFCFAELPAASVGDLSRPIVGRGAAYADIDGDGDLDVLLTQVGGPPMLLRNDQDLGHRWLRVKLIGNGATSNRDAIGARVELHGAGPVQRRQVMPTRSYLSQVERPLTFGLGPAAPMNLKLSITWPDGARQQLPVQRTRTTLVIEQPLPES